MYRHHERNDSRSSVTLLMKHIHHDLSSIFTLIYVLVTMVRLILILQHAVLKSACTRTDCSICMQLHHHHAAHFGSGEQLSLQT
jgi:hypothetical protein